MFEQELEKKWKVAHSHESSYWEKFTCELQTLKWQEKYIVGVDHFVTKVEMNLR